MLHPKKDRIDYGEQLIPPEGYELDFAVGTTYSLNLETLIVLPVALYSSQTLDAAQDEIAMLDYITNSAKKILVFCQKGKISVPNKFHKLIAYWEDSVQEITLNHHAQSFHPKIWLIRYVKEDEKPCYRLIVTSRNLTFAADWDVAFSTEGCVSDNAVPKNQPLIDLITFLNSKSNKKIPDNFIKDLKRVEFEIPDNFHLMNFHPIGVKNIAKKSEYINPLSNRNWDELLAISPFLDKTTLQKISNSSSKPVSLLSVKEELDSIDLDVLEDVNSFQFSTLIRNAEGREEVAEEVDDTFRQDLHAKLFIARRNDYNYWFLGSANLTDPAFGRNIEFMVELKSYYYDYPENRPSRVLKELTDPKDEDAILFEPYSSEFRVDRTKIKNLEIALRKIIFDLTKLSVRGYVNKIQDSDTYDLIITVDASKLKFKDGWVIKLKPLSSDSENKIILEPGKYNEITKFGSFTETQLTPFIHWEVIKDDESVKQFLTRMDIDLPKSRLGKILTSIIDSREKFLKYITFLLQGDYSPDLFRNDADQKENSKSKVLASYSFPGIPIFENLLVAVSRTPKRLKSIDKFIDQIKEENTEAARKILTPEFEEFWNIFKEFIPNDK